MVNRCGSSERQTSRKRLLPLLFIPLLLVLAFPHLLQAQDITQVKKGDVKIAAQVEAKIPSDLQALNLDQTTSVSGGKTIQGFLTCNNGNSGSFALEGQ